MASIFDMGGGGALSPWWAQGGGPVTYRPSLDWYLFGQQGMGDPMSGGGMAPPPAPQPNMPPPNAPQVPPMPMPPPMPPGGVLAPPMLPPMLPPMPSPAAPGPAIPPPPVGVGGLRDRRDGVGGGLAGSGRPSGGSSRGAPGGGGGRASTGRPY